jgi:cytochrome c peroxidase
MVLRLNVFGNILALTALVGGLTGCGGSSTASMQTSTAATPLSVSQALFAEKALSASGQLACASCHTDDNAHADATGTLLPLGGVKVDQQGFRSSPSLMYLASNTAFRFNTNGLPFGGFTWDGRANSRAEQAAGPLLDSSEMANADVAAVAKKVRGLSYFNDFVSQFKVPSAATDQQIFDKLQMALQTYQELDTDYVLFNSKFDKVADGAATFTAAEQRGLAIFNNPNQGNCASCHTSSNGPNSERPLFTNFSYAAIGLPRNPQIQKNADPTFFDMGLCGPKRTDLSTRSDLCGQFKVPTLRNIALTAPYFHNASVSTLSDAVGFYATRDIDPGLWYPVVNGVVQKFNDLPVAYRGNVINTAPFGQQAGAAPLLSAQNVADLVSFLQTLTDDRTAASGSPTVAR